MSEQDPKIVRELFDKAKENFERDGYLAPALLPRGGRLSGLPPPLGSPVVPSCR